MHTPKKRNLNSPHKKKVDWLEYLNDCQPGLVIPVGPRFQADVPEWTGPCLKTDVDSSKWLGTKIWPVPNGMTTTESNDIGKGRPDSCKCWSRGSSRCIQNHIAEERSQLKSDLGPAYTSWKFDEMGEDVAKSWSSKQRIRFDTLVKANPLSHGKTFMKPVESSFPSKTRKDIVNYYLNVYVPRRISMVTRSGSQVIDSDDDEVVATPNAKNSLKRSRPVDNSATLAKSHYLTGRR